MIDELPTLIFVLENQLETAKTRIRELEAQVQQLKEVNNWSRITRAKEILEYSSNPDLSPPFTGDGLRYDMKRALAALEGK